MVTAKPRPQIVLVMGVAGSGKTSIGAEVAGVLGWSFAEGDAFHPPENVAKMAAGQPLCDGDRWPWLDRVARWIAHETAAGRSGIVACSALKRAYRDRLRATWPPMRVVYLKGDRPVLEARLNSRTKHFFPTRLLDSQLADLEPPQPDEGALVVDIRQDPRDVVAEILGGLRGEAGAF